MLVYLADLGHNVLTLSSDVYPLGIANLAAHARARARHGGDFEFRLFREPQDLTRALEERRPDLLGVSNYSWNHRLACEFLRFAKARHPGLMTVMGGPNWPLTLAEQESFLRDLPQLDAYVDGPTYEGERAFTGLVDRLFEAGARVPGTLEGDLPGLSFLRPADGSFSKAAELPRIEDLDEIPSPYRSGLLDAYFATGYFPHLQIARGCPFSCTFCNSGVSGNSRINAHSVEEVKQDLLYVAERVNRSVNLCLADDNFGMYRRDEEIAEFIAWLQGRYGWPRYIRTTTGKNNTERIIKVMRTIHGALPMTAAVQSMNPTVLKNIKRSNIKLETYAAIQKELEVQGFQSYGELILCLPGETRGTFMKAVSDLLDAGAKRISAHQLMLLHGAELATPESRQKFGFDTRFRIVARNFGDYTGRKVVEVEEMVVATPTFSFDDYLDCRVFHLLLTIFYYEGNFEEPFRVAQAFGLRPFDALSRLHSRLASAPPGFRALIDRFVEESRIEIFTDREACIAWAEQHFDELSSGELGGNLLSKYSLSGRFYHMQEALEFLRASLVEDLRPQGEEAVQQLEATIRYLDAVLLDAPFEKSMARRPRLVSRYDLPRWVAEQMTGPLSGHLLAAETTWEFGVADGVRDLIRTKVQTFGEHPQGLGKFTRTMFARDLRRVASLADGGDAGRVPPA